jgi:hypothetical protein
MLKFGALAILVFAGLAAACTGQPAPPAPPPQPPHLTGNESTGEKVALADQYCQALAIQACPNPTIYCDSYTRGYRKICLTRSGVPPEYIIMLLN